MYSWNVLSEFFFLTDYSGSASLQCFSYISRIDLKQNNVDYWSFQVARDGLIPYQELLGFDRNS